jgi:beta-N-acetylhexosaminidase
MSLDDNDRLAGAVLVGGFDGTEAPQELLARLGDGRLAGVTLFKRNIVDAAQVAGLVAALAGASRAGGQSPPLVSIDQEGGRVARLKSPVITLPPMRALGERDDPALTRRALRALGLQLRALGCTTDFAPVADVDSNPANPVIGDRSFSRDPEACARHVKAAVEGLRDAGVLGCAKHFPGHGDTSVDSHAGLPRVAHGIERLEQVELVPFRAVAREVASVMVAHVVYAGVDRDNPASLSRAVVDGILRQRMQYDGVAMTDDLQMMAIRRTYGHARAVELAIRAGIDLAMLAHNAQFAREAIHHLARTAERDATLRRRLEESAARVARMRDKLDAPTPPNPFVVDAPRLAREVEARRAGLGFRGAQSQRDPTAQR